MSPCRAHPNLFILFYVGAHPFPCNWGRCRFVTVGFSVEAPNTSRPNGSMRACFLRHSVIIIVFLDHISVRVSYVSTYCVVVANRIDCNTLGLTDTLPRFATSSADRDMLQVYRLLNPPVHRQWGCRHEHGLCTSGLRQRSGWRNYNCWIVPVAV